MPSLSGTQNTIPRAPGLAPTDADVRRILDSACWIGPREATAPIGRRGAHLLRRRFVAQTGGEHVLHATAEGLYEVYLNGGRVGDLELTPGFSAYRKRLEVQSYDVSALVTDGENTLVVVLSDGWFRGRHGFERRGDGFGGQVGVLLALTGPSGVPLVGTGRGWRSRPSHIWRADLMDGQSTDMRLFEPTWLTTGDDLGWDEVLVHEGRTRDDRARLVAPQAPPVRRIDELAPISMQRPRPGTAVIDFGQAINGWTRLSELGPEGTHLVLTHGEVVDPAGLVATGHLRAFNFATGERLPAGQIDEVISAGRPGQTFEPRHTTHGFRYVQIDGVPDCLDLSGARAVVVHSDLARTGEFTCSDERLNRLHEVVRWSLRDNACAIPTDCPQRERSGFTGDWQIFVATAALMADVFDFSRRWLRDLAADQWVDGRIPTIVPNPAGDQPSGIPFEDASAGSAGWGDAAAIVPWELWRAYGDRAALAEQYPAMSRWVAYAAGCATGHRHPARAAARPTAAPHEQYLWDTGFHFGEWLEPGVPPNPDPSLDHGIVATAYLHRSATIAAAAARILGLEEDVEANQQVADGSLRAWRSEYLRSDGSLTEERQAHYVRALAFGLVPEGLRQASADRLAELIRANDVRLGTGFLSTGLLLQTLADNGHALLAHKLLTRAGCPSWLGILDAGATTMWEYWDGIAPDGTVTGSLNHYSKGAVAGFLHTHLAGLRLPEFPTADEAGYRFVRIAPVLLPGISSASTSQLTAAGPLAVSWFRDSSTVHLDIDLPAGTTADVNLPDGHSYRLHGGRSEITCTLPTATKM